MQGKLTASAVGQIVGRQSEEIKQIASEYAEKVRNSKTRSDVFVWSAGEAAVSKETPSGVPHPDYTDED